jgi:hypothetical protein
MWAHVKLCYMGIIPGMSFPFSNALRHDRSGIRRSAMFLTAKQQHLSIERRSWEPEADDLVKEGVSRKQFIRNSFTYHKWERSIFSFTI